MKKLYKKIILSIVGIICSANSFTQMNYTNLEWVDRSPIVSDSIYHSSTIVVSGKTYVVSNKTNTSGNTDIYTLKLDSNGDTLWSAVYNGSATGSMDYGVEIAYASSYIWVVGAAQNSSTGYDIAVLKYSVSTGSLSYSNNFNGSGGGDDVPTDMLVESSGSAVYVCGGSEATNGQSDMVAYKLNFGPGSGWTKYYDYANLHDGAAAIVSVSTNVVVTGGSAASVGDWDLATLTIHKLTGSMTSSRTNITGATMVQANAMTSDALNNIYVTGYAIVSSEKNIQTVKLDSNLALVWIKDYVGDYNESGNDVGVDNSGNVYVTGYNEITNGGRNFITIKYNSAGTEQWVRQIGNAGEEEYAEAQKVSVTSDGDVFLTGTVENNNGSKMSFVKYDTDGFVNLARDYESDTIDFEALDINVVDEAVYITGLEKTIGITRLTVLKYRVSERTLVAVEDTNNVETHVAGELIVSFLPDSIEHDIINRTDITFGVLGDFVKPGVIDELEAAYPSLEWDKVTTYKMFIGLTTNDTLSISRTGFDVEMPKFWATLLIKVPGEDEREILDSLTANLFPYVQDVQVNHLYSLATDDPHFLTRQHGLYHTSNYPDADMNMIQAWYSERGDSDILVGIYDTGIRYAHNDLGGGITNDGKIRDGKDYYTNSAFNTIGNYGDPHGHGTKVAGIIGAINDNETGVAGIAGGYWPHPPGEEIQGEPIPGEDQGVSLYGFRITSDDANFLTADLIAPALIEGASNTTTGYGYGLHVMNCSFYSNIGAFDTATTNAMDAAHRHVFRNGTVMVAGKGNNNLPSQNYPAHAQKEYWVISVGACDTTGNKRFDSNYGDRMDVIGPGDDSLIYTTSHESNTSYSTFRQTSGATAHVSGLAALMISHINDQVETPNNLAPDDVEFLIQRYADDKDDAPAVIGYDASTGYGLINAGEVMHHIDKSVYIIKHYYKDLVFHPDSSYVSTTGSGTFNFNCGDELNAFGSYGGTLYYIGYTNSHTLNPGDSIYNYWPLNSYTNTVIEEIGLPPSEREAEMTISSVTNTSAFLYGQTFHATIKNSNSTAVDFWWPIAPTEIIKFGYTLHINTDYVSLEENEDNLDNEFNISCYPNPTTGNFSVSYQLNEEALVSIEIIDINGRIIKSTVEENCAVGQHKVDFDVNTMANGIYFVRVQVNETSYYEKFVKK